MERRKRGFSGIDIGVVEEYKYLGVTVKDGLNGSFVVWGIKWWVQIEYLVW